ncbi:MAG TPA: twin-arginine translocase subunit TatC [Savagea sp.]
MDEKQLTVIEHIEELRKRLMIIVVFFAFSVIGSFFLAKPLIKYLQENGEAQDITFNAFNVLDPIFILVKVIVILAIVIISPVIMFQFWSFISPGLKDTERRVTLSYIPFAFFLFLAGVAFSYFVLIPYIMGFMKMLSGDLDIQQTIGINEYFNFLIQLTIPFGLVFQLPVVMLFLSRLGFLNPEWLAKSRKYAYFILFVIAAFITPPDIFSHLFTTVPLILLFEISLFISRFGYKKYLKAEEELKIQQIKEEQQRQIDEVMNQLK